MRYSKPSRDCADKHYSEVVPQLVDAVFCRLVNLYCSKIFFLYKNLIIIYLITQ